MAAVGTRVTVGTSPTAIIGADGVSASGAQGRYILRNRGAVSVDLGGATVAVGGGFEFEPGTDITLEQLTGVSQGEALYGIAPANCRVDVLRIGV